MEKHSYLSNAEISSIENLYQLYLKDPSSVEKGWQQFFEGFEFARQNYEQGEIPEDFQKEFKVINLINGYRKSGHLFTKTNPVRERRKYTPTLDIENFGLEEGDLNTTYQAGSLIGIGPAKLSDIIDHLKQTYCQSIGVEYMYIRKPEVVEWLQNKMESSRNTPDFTEETKKQIFRKLNEAVVFEHFLEKKFTGQKRFSLEGAESLIPALNGIIEKGAEMGIEEFVMGMAHRGRLNVLANIFNKTYLDIFSEFEGKEYEDQLFEGDVKYHLGYSCTRETDSGRGIRLSLCPNPSHLESVDPVVEGLVRSKIDHRYDGEEDKVLPILIHGDASIAAQGVVYEVVQMAKLDGYSTGGTVHVVINNQVGFTTNYIDGRSSIYCTDVGKVTLSPVFHVNGDDVEAVAYTIKMAMEYRQRFNSDVFIDLLCYRKYGHNEADEPRFTQPLLYKKIAKHPNPREIYKEKLLKEGVLDKDFSKELEKNFKESLQGKLDESKNIEKATITPFLAHTWEGVEKAKLEDFDHSPETGVSEDILKEITKKITAIPKEKKFFRKMEKIMKQRYDMVFEEDKLDWGMAELLAYGSLVYEGYPVRIAGQDSERGTFSHRHAIVKVEDSEEEYIPLQHVKDDQGRFEIYNSLLSEYAAMGFDYGYAMGVPNGLTIWEAQFGDFVNGAQIIIDQFLCCAEEKWKTMNGLVLFLPHGYEGQGPEHSSARIERFLALCADVNMQVVNCTTPANFYHVLRRQLHRKFRKPLVIFTPKSLLRHPQVVSSLKDLSSGAFQEVLDDPDAKAKEVEKVVLCSGKIYYDLLKKKEEISADEVALVRLEQLHPLPKNQLKEIQKKYEKANKWLWVQEEPNNMGPWPHILRVYNDIKLEVISRPESGTPATGSAQRHEANHKKLIESVFEKQLVSS